MYPLKFHKSLTVEKWATYTKGQQVLMIANEINRAKNWILKKQDTETNNAYERAFELIDLTVEQPKWGNGIIELLRLREILGSLYISTEKDLHLNNLCYKSLIALSVESYNLLNGK